MRTPDYLSPSALYVWLQSKDDYYVKYLADNRPPRLKQTQPMSVGSAFDAFVKSHIHEALQGKDPAFEFDTIFQTQVEEHNRDFALEAGKYCFEQYSKSGAFIKLMRLLGQAIATPRMEFTDVGSIDCFDHDDPFVVMGKPDLAWLHKESFLVNFDWKVTGYCTTRRVSPVQGYTNYAYKGAHKKCDLTYVHDIEVNNHPNIETYKEYWARQLATYGWLAGSPVGEPMLVMVHEIVCNLPNIDVATHCCYITKEFQFNTADQYQTLWDTIRSGHIFQELSPEQSAQRCTMLDMQATAFSGDSANDEWLRKISGR